ncbi:MAG TPA: hypothetical protein ENG95_03675 [Nitrospirae bacterium]|nr:hypothetical protein [Nitrospirota bacterium]
MTGEIIKRYRVLKDLERSFVLLPQGVAYEGDMIVRAGELCEYFEHSDCYCLPVRQGIVPFVKRKHVEQWTEYFEPIEEV